MPFFSTRITFYDNFCLRMRSRIFLERESGPRLQAFRLSFFSSSYLFATIFHFFQVCLQFKNFRELKNYSRRKILTPEQPSVVGERVAPKLSLKFLSIFVHISCSINPITLIWASLERFFPSAELECRRCQFWSKQMTSKVEQKPALDQHRR